MDFYDVETIVEIFAELAAAQGDLQVSIGRGHDPRVDLDQFPAANSRKLKILDHVQEFRLKGEGKFADLVQVDGPLVRQLELPKLAPVGPGEGPLFMAEEFGFQELTRERCAVHLDKRPVRSRGRRVNGPRHDVLANSAFATEQDGRVDGGDLFDDLPDSPHLGAVAQKRGVLGEIALTECPVCVIGGVGAGVRQGRADGGLEVARVDGAAEHVERRLLVFGVRDRVRRIPHEEERDTRPGEPPEEPRGEAAVGEVHQDEGRGQALLCLYGRVGQFSHDRTKPHGPHTSTDACVVSENKGDGFARHLDSSIRFALRSTPSRCRASLGKTYFPLAGPCRKGTADPSRRRDSSMPTDRCHSENDRSPIILWFSVGRQQ